MSPPSPPNLAAHARQRVLARLSAARLPLGRDGQPLRRRLREGAGEARGRLVAAWFDALGALHAAGLGTEDPLAAAIVTVGERVVLLPDLVWPLGALCARRPIARWLDLADAHAWLVEADPERSTQRAPSPPWPAFPALPGGGPAVIVGPPLEVAALARHAGLPCLPAAHLETARGRAWAARALEAGAAWVIPLADARDARHLRLLPSRVLLATSVGAAPPAHAEDLEGLGQEPDLLAPPTAEAAAGPRADALARALELAPLEADDAARDGAAARTLLAAMEATQDRELLDHAGHFEAIVDLARRAGARELTLRAVLARGLGRLADASADERELGRGDLVEARRLAQASQSDAIVVLADAAALLAAALERDPRAEPDGREVADARALAWRTVARAAVLAARDESRGTLDRGRVVLGLGLLEGDSTLLGLAIELVGRAGVLRGAEAAAERLLAEVGRQSPPRALEPLLLSWQALLAARRGATLTARDRLLEVGALLDPARSGLAGARHRWSQRAAGRAALAARVLGMDGLVSHFGATASASRAAGVASAPAEAIDSGVELPTWLLVAAAELARELPESRLRQARQALRARLERLDTDNHPAGATLALGRLDAATGAWDLARRGLAAASAGGEAHVEREALEALAAVLAQSGSGGEEAAAVTRRLEQLRARSLPLGLDDAPPPLSRDAREAGAAALVARAADAGGAALAARGDGWRAAVEALCGPVGSELLAASSAAVGLELGVASSGEWRLAARDGSVTTLEAPRLAGPPSAVAAALEALAPLFAAQAGLAPPPPPDAATAWAGETHAALLEGEVSFDDAVIAPFRAHDLTRGAVRALLDLGLRDAGGLYRTLARAWGVADGDYQRFMDFLRRANAALDYRAYRRVRP